MADLRLSGMGGIPFGNTAARPTNPVIGTVYYNGQLEILEIFNGTTWVASSAPPATPSISTPTDSGTANAFTSGGELSVVFTPGSGGGTPNQYNTYTTAGGFTSSSSNSTVVITGLTPGTAYTVYGTAQNNFGTTVNTANAAAVIPTTKPQAPTIGTASNAQTGGTAYLTFTAGNSGGKSITNYKYSTDGITYTALSPAQTSSPLTISGLTNGVSYSFYIKAVNNNGESPSSSVSNSVTPTLTTLVHYLVLGGGGGGGTQEGGGGGAGGLRSTITASGRGSSVESAISITNGTSHTITVGAGGAGTGSSNSTGTNGNNSIFSSITSLGGGGGGQGASGDGSLEPGKTGGCGGGGGSSGGGNSKVGGAGTTAQGFDGGTGGNSDKGAGGGGGTGSAGSAGSSSASIGGSGGSGTSILITGTSVTYGGGGGGGIFNSGTGGVGGSGGGGSASNNAGGSGTAGTANLGGGGGGGNYSAGSAAAGGAGVVILRWLTANASINVGSGLTSDATGTDGVWSYKRFTAGTGTVSFS